MSIPNLISIFRLITVPIIVFLMIQHNYVIALWLFIISGISDGLDGFVAKHFNMATDLGAHLDPIADKALLVAVFLTLAFQGLVPVWLAVLVVSRDIMIVGAVLLSWILHKPVPIRPLFVSKANTAAQITLVAGIMAVIAYKLPLSDVIEMMHVLVGGLTIMSAIVYVVDWARHMSDIE